MVSSISNSSTYARYDFAVLKEHDHKEPRTIETPRIVCHNSDQEKTRKTQAAFFVGDMCEQREIGKSTDFGSTSICWRASGSIGGGESAVAENM
jgi:hypothetical protein